MMKKQFGRTVNGEPRFWWHSQDLQERGRRKWFHRRWWLNWQTREGRNNAVGMELVAPGRYVGAAVTFDDTGDYAILVSLAVWVATLYIHLERAKWVRRLPGVRWQSGDWLSGKRLLRLEFWGGSDAHFSWTFWANPDSWSSTDPKWRKGLLPVERLLYGDRRTTDRVIDKGETVVPMPEGDYPATWTRTEYTTRWSRWPRAKVWHRWTIDVEKGIPFPGKGENSWDCGEDAVYSSSAAADTPTLEAAVASMSAYVTDRRRRYGGPNWLPAKRTPNGD